MIVKFRKSERPKVGKKANTNDYFFRTSGLADFRTSRTSDWIVLVIYYRFDIFPGTLPTGT